ncbi:MAG: hypothetical protein CMN76_11925 [Spirochaetaceae bacterium]|nr:hypothetical protein [Spirochaetaceae bacterium]|tara:strand:- start:103148 stop:103747 length:600 start_codon:yes stop_codon:yes gene_type:complete
MVRPRSEKKDQALVEAATRLFLRDGIKATTVQSLAREAGVGTGTVYTYFKDKKDIVRTVAYEFAAVHDRLARKTITSRKSPGSKLTDYILELYDIWRPFGQNSKAARELAEAVFAWAPETPDMAEQKTLDTLEAILSEAKQKGFKVDSPQQEARLMAICLTPFFPLAGTPNERPWGKPLTRKDLESLLAWMLGKISPPR